MQIGQLSKAIRPFLRTPLFGMSLRNQFLDEKFLGDPAQPALAFMSAQKHLDVRRLDDAVGGMVRGEQVAAGSTGSWDIQGQPPTEPLLRDYDLAVLGDRAHWEHALLQKYLRHLSDLSSGVLAKGGASLLHRYEANFLLNAAHTQKMWPAVLKEEERPRESRILEVQHLQGLNTERGLNLATEYYKISRAEEGKGFVKFSAVGGEDVQSFRQKNKQMLLRVLLEVSSGHQLLQEGQAAEGPHSFTHHVLFENQLVTPPEMAYYKTDTPKLLSHFRLSPSWRLVDTDYFLKANPVLYSAPLSHALFRETPL